MAGGATLALRRLIGPCAPKGLVCAAIATSKPSADNEEETHLAERGAHLNGWTTFASIAEWLRVLEILMIADADSQCAFPRLNSETRTFVLAFVNTA